jgi:thiol-disulfide isomerase/thioredoxin
MNSLKKLIPIVVVTAIAVFYITGFNRKSTVDLQDQTFNYSFSVKDMDGQVVPFDTYKGKVVFLNLWATWCGPCRKEMPDIQKLYDKIQSEEVAFVMLSIDTEGDEAKVRNYIKRNNFSFPVVMPSGNITSQLNVPSIPTTFIINKEGKIVHHIVGSTNYNTEKYRKMLQELAAE